MRERGMRPVRALAATLLAIFVGFSPKISQAATVYNVELDTSGWTGNPARLAFDFTSNAPSGFNAVTIRNFIHDGTTGLVETQGGGIHGDIIEGANPAVSTSMGDFHLSIRWFYTPLVVPFESTGTFVRFTLNLTESVPTGQTDLWDEVSVFFLDRADALFYPSGDPFGTGALFSICITGAPGGDLAVFSPMEFVPPATIRGQIPPYPPPPPPGGIGCPIVYQLDGGGVRLANNVLSRCYQVVENGAARTTDLLMLSDSIPGEDDQHHFVLPKTKTTTRPLTPSNSRSLMSLTRQRL
jgi:hypothetical protein